eukprot:GHVH01004596.1.p1 GENE.GHVH01004596.1~~GHVH01004596.1.p1  ORF type:complete len:468 (+),score=66.33 GHVH01004596.1:73-1476(+)
MDVQHPLPIGPTVLHRGNILTGHGPQLKVIHEESKKLIHEETSLIRHGSIVLITPVDQGLNSFWYLVSGDDRTLKIVDGLTYEVIDILFMPNRFAGMIALSNYDLESVKLHPNVLSDENAFVVVYKFGDLCRLTLKDLRVLSNSEMLRAFKHAAINPNDTQVLNWVYQILGKPDTTSFAELELEKEISRTETVLTALVGELNTEDKSALDLEHCGKGSNSMMAMTVHMVCAPVVDNAVQLVAIADKDERLMLVPLNQIYNTFSYCLGHRLFVTDCQFLPRVADSQFIVTVSADCSLRLWNVNGDCITVVTLPSRDDVKVIPVAVAVRNLVESESLVAIVGLSDGALLTVSMEYNGQWESASEVVHNPSDGVSIQNVILTSDQDATGIHVIVVYLNGAVFNVRTSSSPAQIEQIIEASMDVSGVTENYVKHSYLKGAPSTDDRKAKRLRAREHTAEQKRLQLLGSRSG